MLEVLLCVHASAFIFIYIYISDVSKLEVQLRLRLRALRNRNRNLRKLRKKIENVETLFVAHGPLRISSKVPKGAISNDLGRKTVFVVYVGFVIIYSAKG